MVVVGGLTATRAFLGVQPSAHGRLARPGRASSAGCAAQDLNILNILLTPGGCGTFRAGVERDRAGVERDRADVERLGPTGTFFPDPAAVEKQPNSP